VQRILTWKVTLMFTHASLRAAACAAALAVAFAGGAAARETPQPSPAGAPQPSAAEAPPRFKPPALIDRVEARYPEEARKAGQTATVLLQLTVGKDGTVGDVSVVKPAGHGFDESAVEAALKLRFEPATQDGTPVAAQINYQVHFELTAAALPTLRDTATGARGEAIEATRGAPAPLEATVEADRPFTTASASTVRDRDFLLRPRITPEDILRVVPGLVLAQHQGGGKADQLFLRGFDADHGTDVSINIDGIPVNLPSHAHGQGFADLHFLLPEAIERVEIVKGPYSAEYGDFNTAGAVNLVTRDRFEHSQVSVQGGIFPSVYSAHDAEGGGARGMLYRFFGVASPELESARPYFAAEVYGAQGPFQHGERLERYNLFAKLTFDLSSTTRLSLLAMAYASSWFASGQIPSRLVDAGVLDRFGSIDPTEGGDTQRQQLIIGLKSRPNADSSFTATASVIRYGLTLYSDFTFQARNPADGDEIEQDDQRTVLAANLKYQRSDRGVLPGALHTHLGVQIRSDDINASLWKVRKRARLPSCLGSANPCISTNDRQTDAAAYLQEEWNPIRPVRLILGLRTDLFVFDVRSLKPDGGIDAGHPTPLPPVVLRSIQSPKASLVLTPVDALDLFFNFGAGFHSNDARSVIESSGVGALPRALGYEVGARTRLLDNRLNFAAALWLLDLESELVWSGDEGGTTPSSATRRHGLDLEGRYEILPWLFADLDVSLAHSQYRVDFGNGRAVALAPQRIVTGGLTARHPSGLQASLRLRHIGPRPGSQLDATSPLDPRDPGGPRVPRCNPSLDANDPVQSRCFLVADGYTVLDAVLGYQTPRYGLNLVAENLANAAYREAQFGNVSQVISPPDGRATGANGRPFVPESHPVQDIHFTPGNPFGLQLIGTLYF
jgi:TonB family protein